MPFRSTAISGSSIPAVQASTPGSPLLTLAIPTWNRAPLLAELLAVLQPQLLGLPPGEVDLLISDNGSTDATADVVARFAASGLALHHHRHPENIGSDANFIAAYNMARGRYFWLVSDDDIPVPGSIASLLSHLRRTEFDLIYATSYGFHTDWAAERQHDPLHRRFHIISSPAHLVRVVNIMFTFISGMVVNKERLEMLRRADPTIEPPSAFLGTNLTQLSWTLPLLRHHRRSLVLWDRPVAAREGNAGGYSIGHVFGEKLTAVAARCLPDQPDLQRILTNFTLRRWFPDKLLAIRSSASDTFSLQEAEAVLRRTFGSNPRFWIFTWPVLRLPMSLARLWLEAGTLLSKLIYILEIPGFWRKQT